MMNDNNKATQILITDMLERILSLSSNPGECGEYITTQIRELIGAKIVALLQAPINPDIHDYEITSVYPKRHLDTVKCQEVNDLCRLSEGATSLLRLSPQDAKEKGGMALSALGFDESIVIPLKAGDEHVGALLLLDLLSTDGIGTVTNALTSLSGVIGLIFKNSILFKNLDVLVEERTSELKKEIVIRKQAEEETLEREEHVRLLLHSTAEGIYGLDLNGNCTFINRACRQLLGYGDDDNLIGRHMHRLMHHTKPDGMHSPEEECTVYKSLKKKEGCHVDNEVFWRADGTSFYVEYWSYPIIKDNSIVGAVVTFIDITGRKKAQEALQLNKERLESLLALHQLKKMSEKELCHYALEEGVKLTKSKVGYLHFVDDDVQEISLNYWSDETLKICTAEKTPHYPIESAGIWADCIRLRKYVIHNDYPNHFERKGVPEGHFPILRHLSVPVFDKERIVAVVGVGNKELPYDSSDALQLSLFFSTTWDMLKKQREGKEKKNLEVQLRQAQKMESIGTLAGGIAHDFNNILAAVLGYTELAQTEAEDQAEITEYLAEVFKAGNRAKELVKQILTFSRQTENELYPLQIHLVVKEALKLLRSSIPTTIEIRKNIDAQSGTVLADPTHIHQVIMNLCTNAYHAMREKGGILAVELKRIDIEEGDEKITGLHLARGPYIQLSVSDNGSGMDLVTLEKIFEPYFTTKKKGEGTGLGLALVHGIVKTHGGHIAAYSEPGEGTSFHVYLPRVVTKVKKKGEQVDFLIPTGHERIIIVDDEEPLVKLEHKMLTSLGYQVTSMTSPKQALETFTAHPHNYDLIITDMTMPGMNGAELCQRLLAVRPDLPIILCTGFSELINKEKAESIGIREYIMKPVVRMELACTIRKVLDNS